jgi:hypothetical protein
MPIASQNAHVALPAPQLELDRLGNTRRLAIRKLLTEFRTYGWRDTDGAAIVIVDRLAQAGGHASPESVAGAVPSGFLAVNGMSRSELSQALGRLAARTQ